MTRVLALRSWGRLGVPPPALCPLRAFPIPWGAEARQAAGLPRGGERRGGSSREPAWRRQEGARENPSIFSVQRSKSVHYLKMSHPTSLGK